MFSVRKVTFPFIGKRARYSAYPAKISKDFSPPFPYKKKEGKHSRCDPPWIQGLRVSITPCWPVLGSNRPKKKEDKKKKVVGSGDNHMVSTMDCSPVVFGYLSSHLGRRLKPSRIVFASLPELPRKLPLTDCTENKYSLLARRRRLAIPKTKISTTFPISVYY